MLVTMLLSKENLNSLPKNHGKKDNKKETSVETVELKREEKEDRTETEIVKKDLVETDNKERGEEREDAAEIDSDPTIA